MPIPFIIGLIPLFLSPIWSGRLIQVALKSERAQIAVDNAAILAGRRDRETLNFLARRNVQLRKLDAAHHAAHLCAYGPGANTACVAADRAAEAAIQALRMETIRNAEIQWFAASRAAQAEFHRVDDGRAFQSDRPLALRLDGVTCSVCGRKVTWELSEVPGYTFSSGELSTRVELLGESLSIPHWGYRLWEGSR